MKFFKSINIITLLIILAYMSLLFHIYINPEMSSVYPSRPVVIIVHSKPGSGVDLMARKISDIIRKKNYSTVPFVIENRSGTQGVVAMQYVLDKEPDGYTMLAVTKSFLSTLMVNKSRVSIEDFKFISAMLFDPEAIIVNKNTTLKNLKDIIMDAKKKNGEQVWIGPGTGGRDHLMAIKTWEKLGIKAKWIDYKTGPQSVLALMRNEASVYVGNPIDIRGKENLKIIAIAAPDRLQNLPDIKTFKELGYELNEYMWRGLAFRKEVDPEIIKYMNKVLTKVSRDPEWLKYNEEVFALPIYMETKKISRLIQDEIVETNIYLKKAKLLKEYIKKAPLAIWLAGIIIFLSLLLLTLIAVKFNIRKINQDMLMSMLFIWLALFFFYQTTQFSIPSDLNITDPAFVPFLWITLLILLSIILFIKALNRPYNKKINGSGNIKSVLLIIILLILYFFLIIWIGYFIATVLLIAAIMNILNYRIIPMILISSMGFVIFSYVIFELLLKIKLPVGRLLS
ncbi:MAG: tripartite tricarboxylate transporter substrate-binding protein [Acidobacteriota bacterium]